VDIILTQAHDCLIPSLSAIFCRLGRRFAAASLLGLRVRIRLRSWMFVSGVWYVLLLLRSLRLADHSFRGVLKCVFVFVCLTECDLETSKRGGLDPIWGTEHKKNTLFEKELLLAVSTFIYHCNMKKLSILPTRCMYVCVYVCICMCVPYDSYNKGRFNIEQ